MTKKTFNWLLIYQNIFHDDDEELTLRDTLSIEEVRLRDRRIPRVALRLPGDSPFDHLFDSQDDQALITLTGFSHTAVSELEIEFTPLFQQYTPHGATAQGWSI